jgi:hypothetical protein
VKLQANGSPNEWRDARHDFSRGLAVLLTRTWLGALMFSKKHGSALALLLSTAVAATCAVIGAVLPAGDGLVGEYYRDAHFSAPPFLTTADHLPSTALIADRWGRFPPQAFSVVWTGFLTIGTGGVYEFATTSDDGSRFFVDHQLVIDNSGNHGPLARSGRIQLSPGSHPIRLEYSEAGGGSLLSWTWDAGGGDHRPVPRWRLSRAEVKPAVATTARVLRLAGPLFFVFAVLAALWTFRGHSRRFVDVAAMGAAIISALPTQPVVRTNYYEYQVHLGFVEGLQWGTDIACTYGPLGFVGVPLFHSSTFAWMVLGNAAVLAITAGRLFVFVGRIRPESHFPGLWSAAALLPLTLLPVPEWSAALFCIYLLAIAISLECICSAAPPFRAIDAAAAAAIGFLAMVKISAWPLVPLLIATACFQSRRHVLWFTTWFGIAAVSSWLVAGQPFSNLVPFVTVSLQMIAGFKNELAIWRASSQPAALFIATGTIMLVLLAWCRPQRTLARWLLYAVPAAVIAQLFQSGFVRADRQHIVSNVLGIFALAPLVVAVVVGGRGIGPLLRGAMVTGAFVMLLRGTPGVPGYWRPRAEWSGLASLLTNGTDPLVVARQRSFAEMRASHRLPIDTLDGAVAIWSGDIGILEANGVRIAVQPTLTSYAAYTAGLQLLNQEWLERPSVRWVVWCGPTTVDDRYPSESDSKALVYLASHFSYSAPVRDCSLLRRTPAAGWVAPNSEEHRVAFDDFIPVPAEEGTLVWAEISAPETPLGRLVAAAVKPVPLRLRTFLKDGTMLVHPITPAMTRQGFLLSPYTVNWQALGDVAAGQRSGKQVVGIQVGQWSIADFSSKRFYQPQALVRLTAIRAPVDAQGR